VGRKLKVIAWIAAAMLALFVAACGGDDEQTSSGSSSTSTQAAQPALQKGATVRLWVMNNGPQPVKDTEQIVRGFEQQTGVNVDVELVGWDVQFDRIRNAAVSGGGPDVTQAGTTQVPFFAALGGFADLNSRVKDVGGKGAYAPGIWQTTQLAGQNGTYAVPWFTEARAIYYRKDVLEKAGIDPATAFKDWNSLTTTLQTIKDKVPTIGGKPIEPFGSPGKKAFDLVHHVMPFVWDAGGAELSADDKKSTIDSPQSQQGVDFVASLLRKGLYDKSMLERDGTQVENQFKGGRLAVWIGGPWVLGSVARKDDTNWVPAARANVGVAPMPSGPSGKGFTFVGGSNLMMLKNSKHPNEAWALMKYLSGDSVQTQYANLMGMFPARLAPQKQLGSTDPDHKAFFAAIQQGRTYAPIAQWAQIENAYKARFGNILDSAGGVGGKPFSDAEVTEELDAAAKEADALLAQSAG
jgi:multiple sugar transport system substrate-binding protein